MKAYITKYALTKGIIEADAHLHDGVRKVIISTTLNGTRNETFYRGNDFHITRAEAIADAYVRRNRKIASLEKELAKTMNLTF